jgi:hypothetical protein
VQRKRDAAKARRWPLAMSILLDQRRVLGDLFVVTARRDVAAWAKSVSQHRARAGSALVLTPVVVLLAGKVLDALLDPKRPELAFFAAWAMQARKGKAARAVVRRSLELTEALPEPLRRAQVRAIFNVLSQAMLAWLKEASVSTETFPESPWVRAWRLELEATGRSKGIAAGKAEGKAEGVLMVLRTRGLAVTDAQVAVVRACRDLAQLDGWLCGAVTATSAEALLGPQG